MSLDSKFHSGENFKRFNDEILLSDITPVKGLIRYIRRSVREPKKYGDVGTVARCALLGAYNGVVFSFLSQKIYEFIYA